MASARHFIKAWRKHRDMTLEKVVELVGDLTAASLSRIERGKQPYNQGTLEALAVVLDATPAALLGRDPKSLDVHDLFDDLDPATKAQAARLIRALKQPKSDAA
jgi:transcriptional regulator with XRE-family HTH domain